MAEGLFSERNGFSVKKSIQIECMDDDLKNSLFNVIFDNYNNIIINEIFLLGYNNNFLKKSNVDLKHNIDYLSQYYSQVTNPLGLINYLNDYFNDSYIELSWSKIYDFLEYLYIYFEKLKASTKPHISFVNKINEILEREKAGYRFINGKISPIIDKVEIDSIQEAHYESQYIPVKEQLEEALRLLSDKQNPKYKLSIQQSICAVETKCKKITKDTTSKKNKNNNTLGDALNNLERNGIKLPPLIKSSMEKLYNYTNNEEGIRHGQMVDYPDVNQEEAIYMLVTASAFINYLRAKVGKKEITTKAKEEEKIAEKV